MMKVNESMNATVSQSGTPGGTVACLLQSDLMVPMRDGVRLATDVYLPAAWNPERPEAFPVILERTPYDKTVPSRSERSVADPVPLGRAAVAAIFVARGYVFVYQDCRGTHNSEGRFTKYLSEGEDGFDTIAWIAAQPWCNGRVGMMGLSYAAHTQVAAACLNPPALKALFVDSGGFHDAYQGGIRQGGAFELKQATWAMKQAMESPEAKADPRISAALAAEWKDIGAWFTRLPWRRGQSPLRWLPEFEDYLFDQWTHGDYDGFWQKLGICSKAFMDSFADIPMVHMSSWFDPYPRTATTNYRDLKARGKGPLALILGPWTHGDRCLSYAGDVDFGPAAPLEGNIAPDFFELRLAWFDRWLKATGSDPIDSLDSAFPAVRYFRMGGGSGCKNEAGRLDHGGQWLNAPDWPLPDATPTSFHLRAGGLLSIEGSDPIASSITYRFDPAHPVPSIGGTITSGEPIMRGGAWDQVEGPRVYGCTPPYLPLSSRPDVLVFESPVLEEDLEVTGPVSAELFISSDCPDTDFTIKLIDLYPPSADYPRGFAMNITDGILRARYRNSWNTPSLLSSLGSDPLMPGSDPTRTPQVHRILVEAFPTSNLFVRGHRIRLDISSSNFPHFDVNPNTGDPEGSSRGSRIATNSIHIGPDHPSRLILPLRTGSEMKEFNRPDR
jgi:putative CocE/NonD family hydrolase